VRGSADEVLRNEVFICGVFSLLDRMFQQPFKQLLDSIPVPPGVYEALVEGKGPYQPYIEMVRAVESESLFDFREAAEKLMMSVSEINRAQLRALMAASELE
jgi:EAL and modified HD-GYP domain-containing signal transduction protein